MSYEGPDSAIEHDQKLGVFHGNSGVGEPLHYNIVIFLNIKLEKQQYKTHTPVYFVYLVVGPQSIHL